MKEEPTVVEAEIVQPEEGVIHVAVLIWNLDAGQAFVVCSTSDDDCSLKAAQNKIKEHLGEIPDVRAGFIAKITIPMEFR